MTPDDPTPQDETSTPDAPAAASIEVDPAALEAAASQAVGGLTQVIGAVMASQQEGFVALATAQKLLAGVTCPRTHKPPVFSLDFAKGEDGESRSQIVARAQSKIHRRKLADAAKVAGVDLKIKVEEGAGARKKKKKTRKRSLGK